jgi:mannitol/fructose-specific phosphotransferase system IIA component (Ntr-type)
VVILMLVPPAAGSGYTTFLGTVSRTLMDEDKRAAMIAATDRDSVLKILRGE